MGLDNVGLGGDNGVKKRSEERWADAVFVQESNFKRFVEVGRGTSLWKHTLEKLELSIRLNSRPPQI